MFLRHSFFSLGLFVSLAAPGAAQSIGNITIVPIAVDQSVPIPVIVTNKVPYRENAHVQARVIQPIYAYDRQVIPPGAELEGHIAGFRQAPAWTHVSAMLGGD